MNTHILYHDPIFFMSLLLLISFPSGYLGLYSILFKKPSFVSKAIRIEILKMEIQYFVSVLVAVIIGTIIFYDLLCISIIGTSLLLIVGVGIIFSILALIFEVLIGKILTKRRLRKEMIYYEIVSQNPFLEDLLVIFIIPIIEEYLYRGVIFSVNLWLTGNIIFAILFSSIVFGLNHGIMGTKVVVQKFFAGILFGMVLTITNYSLSASIICHIFENLMIRYFYS